MTAHYTILRSSVVRASDRCTEGHGFDSRRGLRFFSLSHARDKLNTVTNYSTTELNIYHLYIYYSLKLSSGWSNRVASTVQAL